MAEAHAQVTVMSGNSILQYSSLQTRFLLNIKKESYPITTSGVQSKSVKDEFVMYIYLDTKIMNVNGRVFFRDTFGLCSIQLDGFPSVVRVRPCRQGIAHHLKLRGCCEVNPTRVKVDLEGFDPQQHIFHGSVRIDDGNEQQEEFESVKSRKMMPMIV
jgi:hypothetical protein